MKRFCEGILLKYSKTDDIRTEFDDIAGVALIHHGLCGQQVLDPEWTWRRHIGQQLLNLCLFVYVIFGTLDCLNTTNDVELIVEALFTLILIVFLIFKCVLFMTNRFVFRKLYRTAKITLIDVIKADSESNVNDVLRSVRKMVYFVFQLILVPCSIYELTAFWNYITGGRRGPLSRSTNTLMPMSSPYYETAWILHTIFLVEISLTIVLDLWFPLLAFMFCKSVDALVNILSDQTHEEICRERLGEKLKKFHALHVLHVDYMNTLSSMYKWLALAPLCNATMGICSILLLMSNLSEAQAKGGNVLNAFSYLYLGGVIIIDTCIFLSSIYLLWEFNWKFAPHMLSMFAEILAYNWFGEQIKTKAQNIQDALINFDWINLKKEDRRSYYIMLTYMNKEFGVQTAIGNLSLVTMTAILKLSYQTFTVLRTYNS